MYHKWPTIYMTFRFESHYNDYIEDNNFTLVNSIIVQWKVQIITQSLLMSIWPLTFHMTLAFEACHNRFLLMMQIHPGKQFCSATKISNYHPVIVMFWYEAYLKRFCWLVQSHLVNSATKSTSKYPVGPYAWSFDLKLVQKDTVYTTLPGKSIVVP